MVDFGVTSLHERNSAPSEVVEMLMPEALGSAVLRMRLFFHAQDAEPWSLCHHRSSATPSGEA